MGETESIPPMHVERGSTPDGRLLLYFTFGPTTSQPDKTLPIETQSGPDQRREDSINGRAKQTGLN